MKQFISSLVFCLGATAAFGQYASDTFVPSKATDNTVYFSTADQGEEMPILWGLDTAWPDEANIRRGVRFMGADIIGVCRVSFQPWDYLISGTTLTDRLETNLQERLRLVRYIGGPDKVKLVLNNDAPGDMYDRRYSGAATNSDACRAYCNLIYGTTKSCQAKGWTVITASPLNEPDYTYNEQGSVEDFYAIAKMLKEQYPQYKTGEIRISGGNTLNCDCALPWYEYLYDYIDEGNTHQLAGEFDTYAGFFERVRGDGKYATADELHNVMEAIVGVEYGMQTGIWWGTAEHSRGEFCRASFGRRLAYSENRKKWTAAAVMRDPEGAVKAFVGTSERQAKPCSYRFVATDRDVFYNGYGPMREYVVDTPGGDGYQVGQTNAETVVDITWGEDVAPIIDGSYMVMNKHSLKVMGIKGDIFNGAQTRQYAPAQCSASLWDIKPTPNTIGGDFSYYTLMVNGTNLKLDVLNWSLEERGGICIYDGGIGGNEQWFFEYAGDGYFRIFSRHSGLCLEICEEKDTDGVQIVQASPRDSDCQLWRLIPKNAFCETVCPDTPANITVTPGTASIRLDWSRCQAGDVAQYVICRADAGTNDYNTIGRGSKETFFVDNTVVPGKRYWYKVKSVDRALNSSPYSGAVSATTAQGPAAIARYLFQETLADETANHLDAASSEGARMVYGDGHAAGAKAVKLGYNRFFQLPYNVARYDATTISTWINWSMQTSGQTIFDFGRDTDNGVRLWLSIGGDLNLTMTVDGNETTLTGGQIAVNKWQHVAVTIADNRAAIFVDGKLAAESSGLGSTVAALKPVLCTVGCAQERPNTYLNGSLDDFSVYNYCVADASIGKLMDGEIVGIAATVADSPIVKVEYFNAVGVPTEHPAPGVYVVRRTRLDGSVQVTKEVVR